MMNIIKNAIITPDGTELRSYHRHDYVNYVDSTNGCEYAVDGGCSYLKRSCTTGAAYTEASLYDDVPHEELRKHFCWGTYGKSAEKNTAIYVPLEKLSDSHICNILEHLEIVYAKIRLVPEEQPAYKYMLAEQQYRRDNNISVEEYNYDQTC